MVKHWVQSKWGSIANYGTRRGKKCVSLLPCKFTTWYILQALIFSLHVCVCRVRWKLAVFMCVCETERDRDTEAEILWDQDRQREIERDRERDRRVREIPDPVVTLWIMGQKNKEEGLKLILVDKPQKVSHRGMHTYFDCPSELGLLGDSPGTPP